MYSVLGTKSKYKTIMADYGEPKLKSSCEGDGLGKHNNFCWNVYSTSGRGIIYYAFILWAINMREVGMNFWYEQQFNCFVLALDFCYVVLCYVCYKYKKTGANRNLFLSMDLPGSIHAIEEGFRCATLACFNNINGLSISGHSLTNRAWRLDWLLCFCTVGLNISPLYCFIFVIICWNRKKNLTSF